MSAEDFTKLGTESPVPTEEKKSTAPKGFAIRYMGKAKIKVTGIREQIEPKKWYVVSEPIHNAFIRAKEWETSNN